VKVIHIECLSFEAKEAVVTISDNILELVCFAHPFNLKIGDSVSFIIQASGVERIQRAKGNGYYTERVNNTFSHFIRGKVMDTENGIVRLGKLLIELDMPFPGDTVKGEYVSFLCAQLILSE
jgi:hypothetical protein